MPCARRCKRTRKNDCKTCQKRSFSTLSLLYGLCACGVINDITSTTWLKAMAWGWSVSNLSICSTEKHLSKTGGMSFVRRLRAWDPLSSASCWTSSIPMSSFFGTRNHWQALWLWAFLKSLRTILLLMERSTLISLRLDVNWWSQQRNKTSAKSKTYLH